MEQEYEVEVGCRLRLKVTSKPEELANKITELIPECVPNTFELFSIKDKSGKEVDGEGKGI